ncbi:MAG: Na(+)/H(+) antiporter subunit B [Halieaceae bacterium]|nr:Na(+)/H(+) antiporter subunit B [Halieaceae bacterium]
MPKRIERCLPALVSLGAVALGVLIALAVLQPPDHEGATLGKVLEALPDSGVSNPVTAVLLNFRAFDTLLEVGVLLLTLIAVWALDLRLPGAETLPASPLFSSLLRVSGPLLVLVAGYLLWVGASAPGGAFQAGAVLAGGCLLLRLAGLWHPPAVILRWAVSVGLLVFLATALAMPFLTGGLLQYPPAAAGIWILLIETAATVSIAAILTSLFIAREPGEPRR